METKFTTMLNQTGTIFCAPLLGYALQIGSWWHARYVECLQYASLMSSKRTDQVWFGLNFELHIVSGLFFFRREAAYRPLRGGRGALIFDRL